MNTDVAFLEATRAAKILRGTQNPRMQQAIFNAMPDLMTGKKGAKGLAPPPHLRGMGSAYSAGTLAHLKKLRAGGQRKELVSFGRRMDSATTHKRRMEFPHGRDLRADVRRLQREGLPSEDKKRGFKALRRKSGKTQKKLGLHEDFAVMIKHIVNADKPTREKRLMRRFNKLEPYLSTLSNKSVLRHAKKAGVSVSTEGKRSFDPRTRRVDVGDNGKRPTLNAFAHEGGFKGGGHSSQIGTQHHATNLSLRRSRQVGDGPAKDEHNAWTSGIKAAQAHGAKFNRHDARHANIAFATYANREDPQRYRKFFRAGGFRKDMKVTSKESAMNTDKYFQHLLEADLSGDKALVAAWQRAASEIAAKKRKKVMDSLAAKVKQYARPAPTLRSLADKAATVAKPEQPWYIRAGQKLGLLTKEASTDSCYASLMEVMRKDNPELLAHLVNKARERMLYRGDKDNLLPGKKYMRLAKKQFDLHDSIKKREEMAAAAKKTPIIVTPVIPEVPKASGSLTPPAAPPKWSTRKKLALGAGIAAGVGLAGYGAYRWQKNRQKQQAARESTDTCLSRILREGTPETRKLGRTISRQFARISEKAKKTGERGDYFIPHMLKLKAQRLAQQARHA